MATKSCGLENVSFREPTRTDDYLLTRVSGSSTFNIPITMEETSYMFPSELTELICTDTLAERENDTYSQTEIDNKIEDLEKDVEQYAKDATVSIVDKPSDIDPNMLLLNSEHLIFSTVNNE